jgi:hypothetical protein
LTFINYHVELRTIWQNKRFFDPNVARIYEDTNRIHECITNNTSAVCQREESSQSQDIENSILVNDLKSHSNISRIRKNEFFDM